MNPITRAYMQQLGRVKINDRGNAGLVWHAGNKPYWGTGHFIGSATGNQVQLDLSATGPDLNAKQVTDAMLAHVIQQCRIRLVRYILYLSGGPVQIDRTNVGFVNMPGVVSEMGDVSPIFAAGSDVSLQSFNDHYEKLYQRYVARYRNTVTIRTDTICHSSCHSSCYGSRSRR